MRTCTPLFDKMKCPSSVGHVVILKALVNRSFTSSLEVGALIKVFVIYHSKLFRLM